MTDPVVSYEREIRHKLGWQDRAECRNHDPEVFFPHPRDVPGMDRAKRICRSCQVRVECLRWALENSPQWGVWAGYDAGTLTRRQCMLALKRWGAS